MSSENKWLIALKMLFLLLAVSSFITTLPVIFALFKQFTAYRLMQSIVYLCVTGLWTSLAVFLRPKR